MYDKEINSLKRSKNDDILLNSSNKSRDIWKLINNHRGKHSNSTLPEAHDLGLLANDFNKFFTTVPSNSTHNVVPSCDFTRNPQSFYFFPTCENELVSITHTLKASRSCGVDDIPPSFLKKCPECFIAPLTHIINLSFERGVFPSYLKQAIVIPIFKKGDHNDICNYRPISLLTTFSKLFEKIVHDRLVSFLCKYSLIGRYQHGFLKGKNTETALYDFISFIIISLENRLIPCGVLLDLSKAFDSIDHSQLILKLELYGVRGAALQWFVSYLSNRHQSVRLTSGEACAFSEQISLRRGVPQGSILGPLLFVIYFNDVYTVECPSIANESLMINYADDTSFVIAGGTLGGLVADGSEYLSKLEQWLFSNNLCVNHNKTNVILFKAKETDHPTTVSLNNYDYCVQQCVSLLGLTIDECLRWDAQIDKVCKKLSAFCFCIRVLRETVSNDVMSAAYYGVCYPHLKYCIIFWGGGSGLHRVFTLQKKILRTMMSLDYNQSCRGIFRNNNILTVYAIYIFETLIFLFKHRHLFEGNTFVHPYSTRHKLDYCLPKHRLLMTERGSNYASLKLFNKLPTHIKQLGSIGIFKKSLKQFLLNLEPYSINEYFNS